MAKLSDTIKRLVKQHQFDEALTLLGQVNSPQATDWIIRIEAQRAAYKRMETRKATIGFLLMLFACMASCTLYFWFA